MAADKPEVVTYCPSCRQREAEAHAAGVEQGRADNPDHDWRRQMESYGYANVATVMDMIESAAKVGVEQGRREMAMETLDLSKRIHINRVREWLAARVGEEEKA